MKIEEEYVDDSGVIPGWARIQHVDSSFDLQMRCAELVCLHQKQLGDSDDFQVVERRGNIRW
jgi:hypothetical protein